jgi:hypothetical protein
MASDLDTARTTLAGPAGSRFDGCAFTYATAWRFS